MVLFALVAQVGLLLLFENGLAVAQSAPDATRNKHQYCVVTQKADRLVCQDCSAQLGGEGGKLICRYRFGTGTVRMDDAMSRAIGRRAKCGSASGRGSAR
jgi:hypothetical protein